MTFDPKILARVARCFCFLPKTEVRAVMVYLLCEWSNAMACTFKEGAGSPIGVNTPGFIGQLYHDSTADTYYRSTGLTNVDWTLLTPDCQFTWGPDTTNLGDLYLDSDVVNTSMVFPHLATVGGDVAIFQCTALVTLSMPSLTDANNVMINDDTSLVNVDFSSLTNVVNIFASNDTSLVTINLPSFVNGEVDFTNCSSLVNFIAPNWIPPNGGDVFFTGCALNSASIDLVLSRGVAAGLTIGSIDLSGGTNLSHALWSAGALADESTLTTAGVTILSNP